MHDWIRLPSGLYVTSDRMTDGRRYVTFEYLDRMDLGEFNQTARKYDVGIENDDPPLFKLVKFSTFLSRVLKDGSFIPDNAQYVSSALNIMKAKVLESRGARRLADLYDRLTVGPSNAVAEALEFCGPRIAAGEHEGKYRVIHYKLNEDAKLMAVGEILIPGEGWIRTLDFMSGYPSETSQDEETVIGNVSDVFLSGERPSGTSRVEARGRWKLYPGPETGERMEPEDGERRIVVRDPDFGHGRFLDADISLSLSGSPGDDPNIGALRMRHPRPNEKYLSE
jgi:hypothetical protein